MLICDVPALKVRLLALVSVVPNSKDIAHSTVLEFKFIVLELPLLLSIRPTVRL